MILTLINGMGEFAVGHPFLMTNGLKVLGNTESGKVGGYYEELLR